MGAKELHSPMASARVDELHGELAPISQGLPTLPMGPDERMAELRGANDALLAEAAVRRLTDEALAASEASYRRLFETAQDGILLLDAATGEIVDANPFITNMLGYSLDTMVGMKLWEIGPFQDVVASQEAFAELQRESYIRYEDLPLETADGRAMHVEFVSNAYDVAGERVIQCDIRDITARRLTEDALAASEASYRRLFETAQDGILLLDAATGEIVDANPFIVDMLGYPLNTMVGMKLWEIGPFRDVLASQDAFAELQRESYIRYEDLPLETADGRAMHVEFVSNAYDVAGERVIQCNVRDITARWQTECRLHQRQELLRLAEQVGHLGHWSLDLRTKQLEWSDETYRIHGVSRDDFAPSHDSIVAFVHPDDREYYEQLPDVIRRDGTADFEYRIARPNGDLRYLAGSGGIVIGEAGDAMSMFATVQDVTMLRHKERELAQKSDELERFTYSVSHDLKAPLVTIQTFLGYLEQDLGQAYSGKAVEDATYIHAAADKMGRLLAELLQMARIGQAASQPVHITFGEIVEEVLGATAGHLAREAVEVRVADASVTLFGDRPGLVAVWQNLVGNAAKFMGDQAHPLIELGTEQGTDGTVFFVRDNGIGVDPRHQDAVFGMFDQLDPEMEGDGVGLALVKRIVEQHGGTVWLESQGSGHGVCARFTLPNAIRSTGREVTP